MMKITVVMACNEQYAMPLATALRSMVEANRTGKCFEIFVLTSDFSPRMRQRVLNSMPKGLASVRWVPVDLAPFEEFSPPPYLAYLSKMTYVRLLLPQFLPDSVSKVLYLDADILVLGDMGPLWEIDLEGAAFGAVIDYLSQVHAERLGLGANLKDRRHGSEAAPDVCEYFNAGVLLVDLVRWRQEKISEKAMEYMIRNPGTLVADQDALNVACGGLWKKLDVQWNFQDHHPGGYSGMRPEQRPSIIHFAGKWKPWNAAIPSVNASFYDGFRTCTQFARTPGEKARDTAQHSWALLKRFLKRYKLISHIHNYFARPKTADGS